MKTNWPNPCYAATRQYEGGNDDDPRDPGGRTSRGILQSEWNKYRDTRAGLPADVWKAPEAAITDIYKSDYWDAVSGDAWPTGCDMSVWDAGVNSGVSRSRQWAASCLGATKTWGALAGAATALPDKTTFIHSFNGKRLSFLHGLRTFLTFGHGWTTRVASVEALSCKMALEAAGTPAKPALQKKADAAKKSSQKAGGGAAGTATAGTLASTLTTHPVLLTLLGVAVLGALAYGLWYWYIHDTRANALEVAAHA
jgi:lysozyme family protein